MIQQRVLGRRAQVVIQAHVGTVWVMTPAQCIHYCLTRPGVAVVMAGARKTVHLE